MSREFVLVHGMSHGAFCWDALASRLEGRGHQVLAVDLPGHGRRAHEWRRASVAAYARAVADAMALAGFSRAIVVGHSMAGVVIPKVAELVAARTAHLVFLAAVVLPDGGRLLDHLPAAVRPMFAGLGRSGGGVVQYPAAVEHSRWMNDLPAGDPRVIETLPRLTPQPLKPWTERVDLSRFHAMRVPRTYVRCLDDVAVPPARAAVYAARLGVEPIDLPTAHGPMLSDPDALVTILEKIGIDGDGTNARPDQRADGGTDGGSDARAEPSAARRAGHEPPAPKPATGRGDTRVEVSAVRPVARRAERRANRRAGGRTSREAQKRTNRRASERAERR